MPSFLRLGFLQNASPRSVRSYLRRLPLFTGLTLTAIVAFWILELQSAWDVRQWGALVPKEVNLSTMYRLNTYPIIHVNFLHAALDALALLPLLERFEAEHGTLLTGALFLGPFATFPGALYIFLERFVLRGNAIAQGASIWVFLLLGHEAMKASKTNPNFTINTVSIPTWSLALVALVVTSILLPNVGFLMHLCSLSIGYLYGVGYLKFLAPPEKILRWIETKGNLLGRLPHYVSVDQKIFGRYGVLPTTSTAV